MDIFEILQDEVDHLCTENYYSDEFKIKFLVSLLNEYNSHKILLTCTYGDTSVSSTIFPISKNHYDSLEKEMEYLYNLTT